MKEKKMKINPIIALEKFMFLSFLLLIMLNNFVNGMLINKTLNNTYTVDVSINKDSKIPRLVESKFKTKRISAMLRPLIKDIFSFFLSLSNLEFSTHHMLNSDDNK